MQTFWKWLIHRHPGSPRGIENIANRFFPVHVAIAVLATSLIKSDPFTFASKALFPASSILIGMSLAWTTRASTLLQSADLRDALFRNDRRAEDYVYGFQLAILVIMLMVTYVAIMAGGGLSVNVFGQETDSLLSGFWLYLLLSLAMRECWGVVNFTNLLSLLDYRRSEKR